MQTSSEAIPSQSQADGRRLVGRNPQPMLVNGLADQRLPEEQETLKAVMNATADAILSVDVEGRIKTFNRSAERIFGRTRASLQGQSMELLFPERFRSTQARHLRSLAQSGSTSRTVRLLRVKGLRSDGRELDLEGTIAKVLVHQQQIFIACLRDVTERVRSVAELQQSRVQLSELTQKLMHQEKTLVRQLALVLHDQLGQTLAAIRMVHDAMVALHKGKVSSDTRRFESKMDALISQAVHQVRQVLVNLRPPLLDEQGLAAALDNELRSRSLTKSEVAISIEVASDLALMRWPVEVEYAAFMVAREALENALLHASASSVLVRLTGGAAALRLSVNDDGVGIAADAALRVGHLGLLSMHERARAVGATLKIDSGAGCGAQVSFIWERAP